MKTLRSSLFLLCLAFALMLSGCSTGETAAAFVTEETAAAVSAPAEAAMPAAPDMMSEKAAVNTAAGTSADTVSAEAMNEALKSTDRKLIRSISMHVETTEFDTFNESVQAKAADLGGYIESSETSGASLNYSGPASRHAFLKIRIPAEHLDEFLDQVKGSSNVTNLSESTTDVTLQYSDIESHKKSLQLEQERLWELLAKAESLDAVIALEARLSEIRYQLERFESQLRLYDNQVDYSTVELSVSEVKSLTPGSSNSLADRIGKGFQKSLSNLTDGVISLTVLLISGSPYMILVAVLVFAGFKIRGKLIQKKDKNNPSS